MQSEFDSEIDARTQRRLRRDDVRAVRERELAQQTRRQENQRLAAQSLRMMQTREQSTGRTAQYTGRTTRPLTGRFHVPTWTSLFCQLLRSMLSDCARSADVVILIDGERDELVICDLHEQEQDYVLTGATKGRLCITVHGGAPRTGFSRYEMNEADWSARICSTERTVRVEMVPHREITHRIVPMDRGHKTLRFKDFPTWEHGLSVESRLDVGCYRLYHADYNVSYPVLKIVSEIIKEHYVRRDLQGPDAPWDL